MKSIVLTSLMFGLSVVMPAVDAASLPPEKVDQAAIASLSSFKADQAQVLTHLDLTQSFATSSQWTLVVIQDNREPPEDYGAGLGYEHGPMAVCLVKGLVPACTLKDDDGQDPGMAWASTLYSLLDNKIVYSGAGNTGPLLWVQTCSFPSVDGDCGELTVVYGYDKKSDSFISVFSYLSGSNNNQSTRFMADGPLRGDVFLDYPTAEAPYTYWIEVWAPGKTGDYARTLKYRGNTGYGDRNSLPVIYSEMPETLRRLGYWKPGDPLPLPPDRDCPKPSLKNKVLWCE